MSDLSIASIMLNGFVLAIILVVLGYTIVYGQRISKLEEKVDKLENSINNKKETT